MKLFHILIILPILTGCSNLHQVSAERFHQEARMMNTFYSSEYIGQADGKAYLLRKRAPLIGNKWKEEILYTEAKELDVNDLKQLEEIKEKRSSNH